MTILSISRFLFIFGICSLLFRCAPIVIEEDMQKHVGYMNQEKEKLNEWLKSADQEYQNGVGANEVMKKYDSAVSLHFKVLNKRLDDYSNYCIQQNLTSEIQDKYLEKVDLSETRKFISQFKEVGITFNLK